MLFPTDSLVAGNFAEKPPVAPFFMLLERLLRVKWLVLSAGLLGCLITCVGLSFVTPRYKAAAVVIMDSRRDKLADAESPLSSIVVDQYQTSLKSELELITSSTLARSIIQNLDLIHTSEYQAALTHIPTTQYFIAIHATLLEGVKQVLAWFGLEDILPKSAEQDYSPRLDPSAHSETASLENAVKLFTRHLEATNDPKSLTLRISYEATSPQMAATVTNAILDGYLQENSDARKAAAARSQRWLQERIVELRADLEQAEHAVEDFRAKHDLATHLDRSPLEEELLQLKNRRIDTQAQVSAAQAKVTQTTDPKQPNASANSEDVLNSRMITGLGQLEAQLQAQRAGMLATHQLDSRTMLSTNEQLASVQARLHSQIERFTQSNVAELHMAQVRLSDLTAQIDELQARINVANVDGIKLRSFEQDATAARLVLDDFTKRYNQAAGAPLTPPDSRVVSRATVPVDAASPHYALILLAGTIGSAGFAFSLSLLKERFRRGFGSIQELGEELGLVVAGLTPATIIGKMNDQRALATGDTPPLRELAVTIRALAHIPATGGQTKIVLVTSGIAGEGKSTVALSLARSVANAGQRCLLIDADVRKPSLHVSLRVPATPGLVELTLDRTLFVSAIRQVADERFDLLPAGRPTQDPLSPFTVDRFDNLLTDLKERYDVIIIDSAPVLLASEGLILSGYADLTLLMVKWRTTPREIALKAASLITRCSAGKCLAVLTQVSPRHLRHGGVSVEDQYRSEYRLS